MIYPVLDRIHDTGYGSDLLDGPSESGLTYTVLIVNVTQPGPESDVR